MANRYTRALKQIKDATLDEKLKLLEDLPTNNTTGIFVDTPGQYQPQEIIPGDIDSPLNLEQDGDGSPTYDGRDTSGLFQADGTIRSVEPPGDTSYVLGPMSSMYYGWGGFTQIGYIRQSDRKMVNLARITGTIEGWDGESNFTSYGQLTLEQAVWFRDQSKSDYQAFYPGPPSGGSDEYGRYLSQIVDTGKSVIEIIRAIFTPGTNKGFDPSDVFSSILSLILRSDDPSFMDALKSLGVAGKVYLGYLTNLLGDTIDNEFLGQDYVNDSFANMELGYDNNGKLISSVGDNVIGSGQYPTYNPTTNEIELNFNYDFKSNVEEFKDKEGLYGGLAGEIQKGVYNALSPYSVDAQVAGGAGNPLGPLSGAVFGTLINAAKGLGGGKPTPGKITISPQQLQQINPQAYNQLVNSGNVPSDAVDKPSQNKQVPPDGVEVDPEKAIESLKQKLPADKRAQLDFQQTMSMDNFNKLSQSDQNKVMNALQDRHKSRRDGSNFQDAPKYMKDRFKASAKEAGKTKFKDGYMIDKDPNTGKTRKTPIFSTIPGMSSVLVMGNEPSGKLLTESQKRALRNVKKPVKVKEIPTKVKVKPTSRKNKTVGVDMMKVPDTPKEYKPQIDIWSKEDYAANVRASQEKKNHVLEMLGAAEHHWSYLTEEKRRKKQERVNEELAAKYDREMEDLYERYKARQDKVDKTISSFKKPADIAPEYPKDPPPQMVNGYHPKYGKQYKHDKLDPQSAEAMPPTGNPEVDANIKKATNTKEKQRKSKILYKSVRENNYWNRLQKWRYCGALLDESMTTGGLFSYLLQPTGDVVNSEITVNDSSSFSADSGSYILGGGGSFAPFDYTINGNFNGTLSGQSAFTFSAPFNVPGDVTPHRTNIESFDQRTNVFTVENDTITFSAIAGNSSSNGSGLGSNGGTRPSNDLYVTLFVIQDDGSETFLALGTVPRTTTSLTNFEFKIPQSAFGKQAYLNLYNQEYTTANHWWYGTTLPWHPEGVNDNGVVEDFHMILNHANLNPASGWPSLDKTSIALQAWTDMQQAYSSPVWEDDGGPAGYPAPVSGGTRKLGEQDVHGNVIPEAMTMADLEYIVDYIESTFAQYRGMTTTTYGITNLQFKRQLPMAVFVGLDDPEASAFVRDGDWDRLSPDEKKKRLEEQLAASNEYLDKMFGEGMPTGATELSDVQPQQSFMDIALDTIPYEEPSPGPGGYKPPGSYDPNQFYDLDNKTPMPSPNLPQTGPGRSRVPDGTEVASARGPYGTPGADKPYTRKGYKDKDGKFVDFDNPATWPKIPKADKKKPKQTTMVADYKPKGLYISEKKRLKSPKSLADKIPGYYDGKPSPLGFPVEEPPKMVNGYHPDLVDGKKVSQRYNRLDPISAKAMPPTGNPHIDKKVKAAAAKGKKKTFNEFKDLNEQPWVPIAGNGPTNSASQTFAFGDPESGIEYTVNGLGGQTYPSGTEVFGDPVPTPDYSQLAMQGYTPPLSNEVMKRNKDAEEFRKKQDENLQKIKDTLKNLGTSWEEMRSNNWALLKSDGTSILIEPTSPDADIFNWTDNVKITVGKPDPTAEDPTPFITRGEESTSTKGVRRKDITVHNSIISNVITLQIGSKPDSDLNKQLDASEKFTKEINADEFMGGRVTDTTKPTPKFTDTDVSISPEDEKFIDDMSRLPKGVDAVTDGLGTAGDLAIKYAKGDMTPITKSPGDGFDAGVLNMIDKSISAGDTRGLVTDKPYNEPLVPYDTPIIGGRLAGQAINMVDTANKTPTRAALGQFHYEINSSGVKVIDRFNFNDNKNIGALADIWLVGPKLQGIADRLVDIGDRRAIQNGQDPRSDNYGIPIEYTIPWDKVPPGLQNKLDPTATIIPTTKRGRRRRKRQTSQINPFTGPTHLTKDGKKVVKQAGKRVTESTWNKLNRHRGT